MPEHVPPSATSPEPPPNPRAKTILWTVIGSLLFLNAALVFHSCRSLPGDAANLIEKTGRALADVASAFRTGTIRTEFTSYATTITNQQLLQFATLRQRETFTRSEETTTGFGYIPLPEVVVEARAPVEYTYHLDFNAPWNFVLKENVIHVFPPPIRFNKPSIDASEIAYEVKKGYLKTDEALENLKRSLTSLAVLKAKDNIPLVRETCRRQTTLFVETWLSRAFADGGRFAVKVHFPGEPIPPGVSTNQPAPLP